MEFATLDAYLASRHPGTIPPGPLAVVFAETRYLLAPSVQRMQKLGAASVLVIGADTTGLFPEEGGPVTIRADLSARGAGAAAMNRLIGAFAGRWIAWCHNAEFLFFPWCETRTLTDMTTFLGEERRKLLYTYALDLYANPLPEDAAALEEVPLSFDSTGYHAFPKEDGRLDIYGALGWRFEGMVPRAQQHIGRPGLFRASKGLEIGPEMRFESPDYASASCPWHNNPTGAVMTLRRTRALLNNPGFAGVRERLHWAGSRRFVWSSAQLLELGMIEPGQWF